MAEQKESLGRIVMIHGVNTRKENNSLYLLAPAFRDAGFEVIIPQYGFVSAFLAGIFQWIDNRIADSMSAFIQPGDILLGHSNGATLTYLISKKIPLRGAILVNAALEIDLLPNAGFIHVYYNKKDWVVILAGLLPFHAWGPMGQQGYQGPADPRVTNIDQFNPPHAGLPPISGHNGLFKPENVVAWSKFMARVAANSVQSKQGD